MGRKVPLRCSVRLQCRLLRPFSDSFMAKFALPHSLDPMGSGRSREENSGPS
jgi:hypothetical protein